MSFRALRSFLSDNVVPLSAVALFALALQLVTSENVWVHDFFFKRQFVQWLLLCIFAMALFRILRRIPIVAGAQRALANLQSGVVPPAEGMVGRRWRQLQAITSGQRDGNLADLSHQLAEHDAAELDAAYRLSSDVVQILPLIGFFGTVLGLSFGLYENFLREGGATTAAFAKAIAIAFDNTLLGLALTIILFAVQSMLRKREDAILLQLNLLTRDQITTRPEPAKDNSVKIAIDENMSSLIAQLYKLQMLLANPGSNLDELVKSYLKELQELGLKSDNLVNLFARAANTAVSTAQELNLQMDGIKNTMSKVEGVLMTLSRPRTFTLVETPLDPRGSGTGEKS